MFKMSEEKETITIQIPKRLAFDQLNAEEFDKFFSFFDWNLNNLNLNFKANIDSQDADVFIPFQLFFEFLIKNNCTIQINGKTWRGFYFEELDDSDTTSLIKDVKHELGISIIMNEPKTRSLWLKSFEMFIEKINSFSVKPLRYILNELLYNTLEHGRNKNDIPSLFQFIWNAETNELFFIVADIGVGIRQHLRQTYPNLATDSEAILHAIKPQISGTFGRPNTGYETKNNAGVGLYFSSKIVQKLKGDMFIVSGNGFVHISPNEIIAKELDNQWKGTFVYVKIKLGLIKELNFQKMLAEITKSIPKADEVKEENKLYISVRNYFGKYAEDKDLAKKIRDKYILPALAENKTITLDFEDIVSAPHSLLNAMLATPIERLGLAAYKKIKRINVSPDIRETLDFIFDDNTPND